MSRLTQWIKSNSGIILNASSLIATTAVSSILGFVYWWAAARLFLPDAVGIASATVSAMVLLGTFAILGMGTLLITELPRQPEQARSLISTALLVVGSIGMVVGILFALIAPVISVNFVPLRSNVVHVLLFALGVSTTAITQVLDQALIGLLRGGLQLYRNTIFAIAKLLLVFLVGYWLHSSSLFSSSGQLELAGMLLYATWPIGNLFSLLLIAALLLYKRGQHWSIQSYSPRWLLLRKLGLAAVRHHLLNLTLQFPALMLPVLVTALLSAKMNAWFYVSWMIANFVFLVPNTLTIVLHAVNSAQQATLTQKARATVALGLAVSLLATLVLQFAPHLVLSVFGATYADQASWCLRVLVLAAFPLLIKNHYISICRIQDRITQAMINMVPGGILELAAAVLGAYLYGLMGLSLGWVVAISIEALFQCRTVYRIISGGTHIVSDAVPVAGRLEAIWLSDTLALPVLLPNSAGIEALWLSDTLLLPALKTITKGSIAVAPVLAYPFSSSRLLQRTEWSDRGGQFRPWPSPIQNGKAETKATKRQFRVGAPFIESAGRQEKML